MKGIQYYTATLREGQSKRWYRFLTQLHQMPERMKPYVGDITPSFRPREIKQKHANLSGTALGDTFFLQSIYWSLSHELE